MATKSKLKAVSPKKAEPKKPKILIYGKPGVGKTWASLDFPSCYYIDTEGGANLDHYTDKLLASGGLYMGPEQGSLDFDTVIEQVQALATEEHDFKTLVIDSISKLFNTAIAVEAERLGDKNAFGADKKPAVANMRRLINWLTRLDMNVILISHEKPEWGLNAKGERVEIGATFDAWDKLEYELDLCLHILKAGNGRVARIRKSRIVGFKDSDAFPWSYAEFAKLYGKDVMEKKAETIELATPEQLAEIKKLLTTVKLPEGQEEKWLSKAQVEGWEEMSTDRIAAAIEHIKTTFLT
ncbi:ATP-binding protein [Hymenobacter sp. HSC-4F20]|uniref:AAA family ATPase n=1 Tax=Hymenobacter sp. HSC-4F20 TaxID=2864135 RepID=UPI001C731B1C|nr:AAA family ATPase [Hymenobacter sp. HSC-4F20]MBX0289702.1 ATP-binding protein [Hymenobacter sp. HSC-4F20]